MVSHSASFGVYVHCVCEPSLPIDPSPKEEGRGKIKDGLRG